MIIESRNRTRGTARPGAATRARILLVLLVIRLVAAASSAAEKFLMADPGRQLLVFTVACLAVWWMRKQSWASGVRLPSDSHEDSRSRLG